MDESTKAQRNVRMKTVRPEKSQLPLGMKKISQRICPQQASSAKANKALIPTMKTPFNEKKWSQANASNKAKRNLQREKTCPEGKQRPLEMREFPQRKEAMNKS